MQQNWWVNHEVSKFKYWRTKKVVEKSVLQTFENIFFNAFGTDLVQFTHMFFFKKFCFCLPVHLPHFYGKTGMNQTINWFWPYYTKVKYIQFLRLKLESTIIFSSNDNPWKIMKKVLLFQLKNSFGSQDI